MVAGFELANAVVESHLRPLRTLKPYHGFERLRSATLALVVAD